jgi:hypothetical protein
MGGSAGITYSSIANIPKAKRTKLLQEAKPMVSQQINIEISNFLSIVTVRWSKKMQRHLASNQKS